MRQPILDRRWGRIATSALIAGTVLAGCAPKQPQPKEQQLVGVDLYVRGEQAYRKGDKDQALRDYLAAVEKNPNLRIAQARVAEI
jgi:hypothetical protein